MIYHEKQSGLLCAMHTLNNLLQQPIFTKGRLDNIANQLDNMSTDIGSSRSRYSLSSLTSWNPYRGLLGGNYDVNVLTTALAEQPLSSIPFPISSNESSRIADTSTVSGTINTSNSSNSLLGFIVNVPPTYFWSTRHWFAIRRAYDPNSDVDGWWNLDSRLDSPIYIGTDDMVNRYLFIL
ncbi:Machado-joseph disease protein MJD [Syncephalis plumigaleata]|nr:Machado-joseph disease protein MJD [Syncephalis plumigaleata]